MTLVQSRYNPFAIIGRLLWEDEHADRTTDFASGVAFPCMWGSSFWCCRSTHVVAGENVEQDCGEILTEEDIQRIVLRAARWIRSGVNHEWKLGFERHWTACAVPLEDFNGRTNWSNRGCIPCRSHSDNMRSSTWLPENKAGGKNSQGTGDEPMWYGKALDLGSGQ